MAIGAVSGGFDAWAAARSAHARPTGAGREQPSPVEQRQINELRSTDQRVRAHEQAHLSAAAGLAIGGANFQTVRGPDGKQYAVAGEVSIDVSPASTPEQTLDKARRIQAAALAPADPSSQDRAVAAAAAQMQVQAQAELNRQRTEGGNGADDGGRPDSAGLSAYANLEPAPEALFCVFA
jgi:hypothetical protein